MIQAIGVLVIDIFSKTLHYLSFTFTDVGTKALQDVTIVGAHDIAVSVFSMVTVLVLLLTDS
jgi:hypothetical protein